MRCPNCDEEVLLAEVCPYCGASLPESPEEVEELSGEETSGTFVGPLEPEINRNGREEREVPPFSKSGRPSKPGFFSLVKYFFDPSIPGGRKALIVGLIVYILSPIDLIPEFLPIFGWFDDIAIGTFLWSFISSELARYRVK